MKKKEEKKRREEKKVLRKLRLGNYPNFSLFVLLFLFVLSWFLLLFGLCSSNEEIMYKGNVGVLGEMLSKSFQNPCFCFGHNLAISHPN